MSAGWLTRWIRRKQSAVEPENVERPQSSFYARRNRELFGEALVFPPISPQVAGLADS